MTGLSLLGCLCLYGYLLYPAQTFCGMDFLNLDYPRAELIHRAFLQGRVPLWNPYEWGGAPLLAAMQGSVCYPFMWPFLLMPQPFGLQASIFLHVIVAALGGAVAARYLFSCGNAAAAFAGLAYAGGGYFIGRIEQANIVATFSWTPWLFFAAARFIDGRESTVALIAVLALSILPGHPQTTALAMIGCGVFIISRTLFQYWYTDPTKSRSSGQSLLLKAVPFAAISIAAIGVCAVQLFPTQELASLSERVWPWDDPMNPALSWKHLPAIFVPRYYHFLAGPSIGKAFGYTELGLYCGIITLPLFVWGAVDSFRQRHAGGRALVFTWTFAMLFALGHSGGIAPLLAKLVPFFAQSRGAARMLNTATLCYALLAAQGLHAIGAALAARDSRFSARISAAAFIILVVDLCCTNWWELMQPRGEATAAKYTSSLASKIHPITGARIHRFMQNDSDYYLSNRHVIIAARAERMQPNLTAVQQIRTLDGYEEALLPTRSWANLLRRYNRNLRSDHVDARLLSLLGAAFMLTEYPIRDFGPDWTQQASVIREDSRLTIWRSRTPAALLWEDRLTSRGRLSNLLKSTFEESTTAGFIERDDYLFAPPGRTAVAHPFNDISPDEFAGYSCASFDSDAPNSLRLRLRRDVSTAMLLLQPSFPGWNAYIDGSTSKLAIPVMRHTPASSLVLLSASLQPHTVLEFRYEPFSFHLGLFISLVSLSALGAFCLRKHALTRSACPAKTHAWSRIISRAGTTAFPLPSKASSIYSSRK